MEKVWNLQEREEEELGEMEQNEDLLRGAENGVENAKKRKRNKGGIEKGESDDMVLQVKQKVTKEKHMEKKARKVKVMRKKKKPQREKWSGDFALPLPALWRRGWHAT